MQIINSGYPQPKSLHELFYHTKGEKEHLNDLFTFRTENKYLFQYNY